MMFALIDETEDSYEVLIVTLYKNNQPMFNKSVISKDIASKDVLILNEDNIGM